MPKRILIIDAVINLILGLLLITIPQKAIQFLGAPAAEQLFYPSILGAVLIGIGIALLVECVRKPEGLVGLGLGGAVAINLCAGFALALWLVFGSLNIPLKGQIFLWLLVGVLILISLLELTIEKYSLTKAKKSV